MKYQQIPTGKRYFFCIVQELTFRFFVLLGLFALAYWGWELARTLWETFCRELPTWLLAFGF